MDSFVPGTRLSLFPLSPLFDRIFDPEYRANINEATRKVPLLWFMYVLCVPLTKSLVWIELSPTTITHISNLLAAASVICLRSGANPWLFVVLAQSIKINRELASRRVSWK